MKRLPWWVWLITGIGIGVFAVPVLFILVGMALLTFEIQSHANAEPKQNYWSQHNASSETFAPSPVPAKK